MRSKAEKGEWGEVLLDHTDNSKK